MATGGGIWVAAGGFVVAFILLRFSYDKLNDGSSGERGHDTHEPAGTAKIDSQL